MMKVIKTSCLALLVGIASFGAQARDAVSVSISYGTPVYYAAPVRHHYAPVVQYYSAPVVHYRQEPQVIYLPAVGYGPVSYGAVNYTNVRYDNWNNGRGYHRHDHRGWNRGHDSNRNGRDDRRDRR